MKVYTGPLSLFSAKVRIVLAEKGLSPEQVSVHWSLGDRYLPHHPDVVALNPRREVPVLVDGDVVVCDSTAINEYLEETHPEPPLLPASPGERARARRLEAFADEVFFRPLWVLIDQGFYPGGGDESEAGAARARITALHAELDRELAGREWLCERFSLADIANFVMLGAAASLGAAPDPSLENLGAWLASAGARPALAAELGAMQAFVGSLSAPAARAAQPSAGAPA